MNPAAGTTTQKVRVAVVNSSGVYQAIDTDFASGGITTVAPPAKNIPIKRVTVSNHELFANSVDYQFDFFLEDATLDTDENLSVMFPMQYMLTVCDGVEEYDCSTNLVDSTGATEDWNTDSKCSRSSNWVSLDAIAYTLETADKFAWTVSGVGNPEAALTRTPASNEWDFDKTDTSVWTADYEGWTEKFSIYSYDLSDKTYTARSYGNLNAAYVGFNYARDQLIVNSGTRITVYAGSYTTNNAIKGSINGGLFASASGKLDWSINQRSMIVPA